MSAHTHAAAHARVGTASLLRLNAQGEEFVVHRTDDGSKSGFGDSDGPVDEDGCAGLPINLRSRLSGPDCTLRAWPVCAHRFKTNRTGMKYKRMFCS